MMIAKQSVGQAARPHLQQLSPLQQRGAWDVGIPLPRGLEPGGDVSQALPGAPLLHCRRPEAD